MNAGDDVGFSSLNCTVWIVDQTRRGCPCQIIAARTVEQDDRLNNPRNEKARPFIPYLVSRQRRTRLPFIEIHTQNIRRITRRVPRRNRSFAIVLDFGQRNQRDKTVFEGRTRVSYDIAIVRFAIRSGDTYLDN